MDSNDLRSDENVFWGLLKIPDALAQKSEAFC